MNIDYIGLGNRIRFVRKRLGYTQGILAHKAGISVSFFGHIERGSRKASIETFLALAVELNTSIDMLLIDSRPLMISDSIRHDIHSQLTHSLSSIIEKLSETTALLSRDTVNLINAESIDG